MEEMTNPTAQSDSIGLAALSAGLASCLAEENADSNLILSVLGARSRRQLRKFVSRMKQDTLMDQSGSGGPRVAFACGVWSDLTCPLKAAYRSTVVDRLKAEARSVDFINNQEAARGQINAWVAQATSNLIDSVFAPGSITPITRVVLGNAIYFKGKWDEPFNKKCTRNNPFYRLDGSNVDVPFMESSSSQFIDVHNGFKVLKLRYQMAKAQGHAEMSSDRKKRKKVSLESDGHNHTQFSMCIFLPDALDGLPDLIDTIANQHGFLHKHLPKKKVKVNKLQLPRFKLSFESSIVTILSKLGLKLPFSDEADLSRMVERNKSSSPLAVDEVIHKAVIEVNEEGTEAAAITVVQIVERCASWPRPPRGVDFVANHPFAYFIVEEATDVVVFAGHVLDPLREN
ncbi:putative serpin-Z8 [Lolium rigidum]|uniref:putative serpin-Z8 n=1 Tax=Lolium rigidum TaxID=89674 RepID=UPI001F5CC56A|nr:putative serpin-Z8 [Lolium rigidum]